MIKKYFSFTSIALFLAWISFILSLNTSLEEIQYFGQDIVKTINALRLILPLIISFIIILFLVYVTVKKKKLSAYNGFFYLWFAYFFFQIISGLINGNEITISNQLNIDILNNFNTWQYQKHIHLPILSIASIICLFLVQQQKIKLEYFLNILIGIITLVSLVLIFIIFANSETVSFNLYYLIDPDYNNKIINQPVPRITGLSRMLAIINIFALSFVMFRDLNKYNKIYLFIFINILSIFIISAQSRGTFLCFYLSIMYMIFFLVKKNIKKKIKLLVIIVLFPILTTFALNFIAVKIKQQQLKSEVLVAPPSSENRYFKYTDSGRSVLWEKALTKYNYQNLFGYGPQADRRLLFSNDPRTEIHHYGNNVSNGFIYAFLCGGYLSLIFYLIINFKIITNIIKNIKTINNYKNNYSIFYYKLSSTFLIFFFIRQNFENSFSIFGIDFLIVIVCTFIINKNRKFKQN
jgi:hypothetical protein